MTVFNIDNILMLCKNKCSRKPNLHIIMIPEGHVTLRTVMAAEISIIFPNIAELLI